MKTFALGFLLYLVASISCNSQFLLNGDFENISSTCPEPIIVNNGFSSVAASHIHAGCLGDDFGYPSRWRVSHGSPEIRMDVSGTSVNHYLSLWSGKGKSFVGNSSNDAILGEGIMYEICSGNHGSFQLTFDLRAESPLERLCIFITADKTPTASVDFTTSVVSHCSIPPWLDAQNNYLPNTFEFTATQNFSSTTWQEQSVIISLPEMESTAQPYLWIFPYDGDEEHANYINIDNLQLADHCLNERTLISGVLTLPRYSASDHILIEGNVTANPTALTPPMNDFQEVKAGQYVRIKPGFRAHPQFRAYIDQCPPQGAPPLDPCVGSWRRVVDGKETVESMKAKALGIDVFPNPLSSGRNLQINTFENFKGYYHLTLMGLDGRVLMEKEMEEANSSLLLDPAILLLNKVFILHFSDDEKSLYRKVMVGP